jgi:hypothetical protein
MILHSFLGISGSSASPSASCKSLHSAEMDSCMILQLRTRIDSNDRLSYGSSFCLSYIRICIDGCICLSSRVLCTRLFRCVSKIPPQIAFGEFPALRNARSSCVFLAASQSSRSCPHLLFPGSQSLPAARAIIKKLVRGEITTSLSTAQNSPILIFPRKAAQGSAMSFLN